MGMPHNRSDSMTVENGSRSSIRSSRSPAILPMTAGFTPKFNPNRRIDRLMNCFYPPFPLPLASDSGGVCGPLWTGLTILFPTSTGSR